MFGGGRGRRLGRGGANGHQLGGRPPTGPVGPGRGRGSIDQPPSPLRPGPAAAAGGVAAAGRPVPHTRPPPPSISVTHIASGPPQAVTGQEIAPAPSEPLFLPERAASCPEGAQSVIMQFIFGGIAEQCHDQRWLEQYFTERVSRVPDFQARFGRLSFSSGSISTFVQGLVSNVADKIVSNWGSDTLVDTLKSLPPALIDILFSQQGPVQPPPPQSDSDDAALWAAAIDGSRNPGEADDLYDASFFLPPPPREVLTPQEPPPLSIASPAEDASRLVVAPPLPQPVPQTFAKPASALKTTVFSRMSSPLDDALPKKADKIIVAILGLPGTIIGAIVGFVAGLVTGLFSWQSIKEAVLCGAKWGSVVSPPFLGSLYTGISFLTASRRPPDLDLKGIV